MAASSTPRASGCWRTTWATSVGGCRSSRSCTETADLAHRLSGTGGRPEALKGHEGEIALYAWKGNPADPKTQTGGVGWILGTTWVPFQLPTFVTPAFPGWVSGHSTFSRAAAEVMTGFTGSSSFPGGLGEFTVPAGSLKFEKGPATDVVLEWATYYDAADQAGRSRLYGGIHIAPDDLEGRKAGAVCGKAAWELAKQYFSGSAAAGL